MPFDITILPVFLVASFVLLVTPGPDVAFIVATGVTEGRRPALWATIVSADGQRRRATCPAQPSRVRSSRGSDGARRRWTSNRLAARPWT